MEISKFKALSIQKNHALITIMEIGTALITAIVTITVTNIVAVRTAIVLALRM